MLRDVTRNAIKLDWSAFNGREALHCLPAIATVLAAGIISGRPAAGVIAAGGAMSVGFGSFHSLAGSRKAPMLFASLGMSVSAFAGTLAGQSMAGTILIVIAWGFLYGLFTAHEPGASWVALQCVIAVLVASAYFGGVTNAVNRGALVLAGGLLQTCSILIQRYIPNLWAAPPTPDAAPGSPAKPDPAVIQEGAAWSSAWGFGVRVSITLALAAALSRLSGLPNWYWVPMTALIVMKPDLKETVTRGLARGAGTLIGAGLATLLASALRLDPVTLAVLIVVSAWLCYSLLRVNYALFAVCITAYIVFLLALGGLPYRSYAATRVLDTVLGAMAAIFIGIIAETAWRRKQTPAIAMEEQPVAEPKAIVAQTIARREIGE